jgi:hypothetical protein
MSNRMTVENLIDARVRVNAAAHAALVAFRRSKPWRGTFAERMEKFQTLRQAMSDAYGIEPTLEFRGEENPHRVGNGGYDPRKKVIVLVGKLSVVTFLHCFCRARGKDRREAFRWSLSVFKKMFPLSFARCHAVGYMLIR